MQEWQIVEFIISLRTQHDNMSCGFPNYSMLAKSRLLPISRRVKTTSGDKSRNTTFCLHVTRATYGATCISGLMVVIHNKRNISSLLHKNAASALCFQLAHNTKLKTCCAAGARTNSRPWVRHEFLNGTICFATYKSINAVYWSLLNGLPGKRMCTNGFK